MKKTKRRGFKDLREARKPGKNRVRTDPFQRALNVAQKKYDRYEVDLANAREKISEIEAQMPGLRSVIAGLEDYFGLEPSFLDHQLSQPRFGAKELEDIRRNVSFDKIIDRQEPAGVVESHHPGPPAEDKPSPRRRTRGKAGVNQLYVCRKCDKFTASADEHPLCSSCGSNQLDLKQTAAISVDRPNSAGIKAESIELPAAGDDDQFLPDRLPGTAVTG